MSMVTSRFYGPVNMYDRARPYLKEFGDAVLGYRQKENTRKSAETQIGYEQYLIRANERALADWKRNVPNRSIAYPEFSYPGQIYRSNTAVARLGYDIDSATANYYGNLPYRSAGLYGISSRVSRSL